MREFADVVMTSHEVAEKLDIGLRCIEDLCRKGDIRCRKLGGKWFMTWAAVVDYIGGKP